LPPERFALRHLPEGDELGEDVTGPEGLETRELHKGCIVKRGNVVLVVVDADIVGHVLDHTRGDLSGHDIGGTILDTNPRNGVLLIKRCHVVEALRAEGG